MSFAEGDTCKLKQKFDGAEYGPEYLTLKLNELICFAYTDAEDRGLSYGLQLSCNLQKNIYCSCL